MYKKIAITAFVAVAVSAMAQTGMSNQTNGGDGWWQKYNTYNMANVDLGSMSQSDKWRIVDHELNKTTGDERACIENFLQRLPGDQEESVLNALVNNYKQACVIRDEVAMARFGTDSTYAWLNSPALVWTSTPGQNSWSTTTTTTDASGATTTTTTSTVTNTAMTYDENTDIDNAVAMKDDSSRPMRMVMSHRKWRDLSYDEAIWVMDSGLGPTDQANIYDVFHPTMDHPLTMYTNDAALGAIIHVLNDNAKLADRLDRYTWYNHFNQNNWNEYNG